MRRALRRLWALITRRRVEAELDEELRFHLEMETAKNAAQGLSPDAAVTAARRDLGGIERTKDDVREARGLDRVGSTLGDVRYAVRALARSPALLAAVTLTLALGVGATTAIFSVVHAVLLEAMPFPEPERIVQVQSFPRSDPSNRGGTVPYLDFQSWQRDSIFAHVALYNVAELDLVAAGGEPQRIGLAVVTHGFFDVLGVRPMLGRVPTADEFNPATERPLVLSHALWRRLGGREDIVGTRITMTGIAVTVVGVFPPDVVWPQNADAWYPNRSRVNEGWLAPDNFIFEGVGRLKPGHTIEEARAKLDVIAQRIEAEFPAKRTGVGMTAVPLRTFLVGETLTRALWMLLGGIAFVLAIACANIANLQLARAAARQREMAMRVALGASRRRLVRQLVIESLVLAIPGGALGLLVAHGMLRAIVVLAPQDLPRIGQVGLHPVVLGVAAGATLLVALLVGLVPAFQAARAAPADALSEGGARGSSGPRSRRLASGLVVAEVALSLTLLAGAGLLIQSLSRLMRVRTGLDDARVLTFAASLPQATYANSAALYLFWSRLTSALEAEPGVEAVSHATALPLGGGGFYLGRTMIAEGAPRPPEGSEVRLMWNWIAPNYFRVLGQPLVEGRDFRDGDDSAATPAIIVNQAFVRAMYPDGRALGRRVISWRDENIVREIVGVVGDVRYDSATDTVRPIVYVPTGQQSMRTGIVVVRTTSNPADVIPAARRVLKSLEPAVAMARIQTMPEVMRASTARLRFNARLLATFAALALVLAAIGLYGLLAYHVAQRRLEIGVRMALGAKRGTVVKMVLARAMRLSLAGAAVGLVAAAGLSRLMRSQLYEVSPGDPRTLAIVTVLLLGVAVLAACIPAWRATRIHPASALRSD